jgi:hypothetical protein
MALEEQMASEMTATLVKDNLPDFNGRAALYRCDPPFLDREPWEQGEERKSYKFVIASAATVMFGGGPETYLFGANEDGEIIDWSELPGSFKGGLDHDAAFSNAGYSVVRA